MITSPQNARVAAVRKLLRSKERAAAQAFLVEGPHAVGEALHSTATVRELFMTPEAAEQQKDLLRAAAAADVAISLVADRVVTTLTETQHPQGVVAVVAVPRTRLADVLHERPRLVAALCNVADPGNAGTVIRTADAAGADAVVLTRGSVDAHSGKVVRASAGSLFHLPVVTGVDAAATVTALHDAGLTVLATDLDGEDLDDVSPDVYAAPTAWLFGTEAHGLDPAVLDRADRRIRIPIHGRAESLNLAAAAAVCLYTSARHQRRR